MRHQGEKVAILQSVKKLESQAAFAAAGGDDVKHLQVVLVLVASVHSASLVRITRNRLQSTQALSSWDNSVANVATENTTLF